MNSVVAINGEDNYVYFIQYHGMSHHVSLKINLIDIIPKEVYAVDLEKNQLLIY